MNLADKTISIAFISINWPELIIESLLNLNNIFNYNINEIIFFDNTDQYKYELSYKYHSFATKYIKNLNVIYNNKNQLFPRIVPTKFDMNNNGIFGQPLFEQSVNYLINRCNTDYLIIFSDKILIQKSIDFDPSVIWNGNIKNNTIEQYCNIFNITEMKNKNITYSEFIKNIDIIPHKNITLDNQILLPYNLDKYTSSIFRIGNTRGQILYNYLIDNFNYRLKNYENYNSGNL